MATKTVFCSHRGIDKPAVEDFARRLREAGIDAWLDKWEIAPGDNIVARMEEGLRDCDLALIFFSKAYDPKRPDEGRWFHAEVRSLISRRIEGGCRVIPVMLDADVDLPVFLKPLARRGIEEFEAIVDAIEGRSAKPVLGAARTAVSQGGRLQVRWRPASSVWIKGQTLFRVSSVSRSRFAMRLMVE